MEFVATHNDLGAGVGDTDLATREACWAMQSNSATVSECWMLDVERTLGAELSGEELWCIAGASSAFLCNLL